MYHQTKIEMPTLNLPVPNVDILTFGHFEAIVEEIKMNSNLVQQQLNDLLDLMNQIKYHKAIQDNAKIHLKDFLNDECPKESVIAAADEPANQEMQVACCVEVNKSELNAAPVNRIVQRNNYVKNKYVKLDPRFKKKWMTEEIYQLIQARKRFTFAVRLYPESKFLKSQLRFYELAVNNAVDRRKAIFYGKFGDKPNKAVAFSLVGVPTTCERPKVLNNSNNKRLPSISPRKAIKQ